MTEDMTEEEKRLIEKVFSEDPNWPPNTKLVIDDQGYKRCERKHSVFEPPLNATYVAGSIRAGLKDAINSLSKALIIFQQSGLKKINNPGGQYASQISIIVNLAFTLGEQFDGHDYDVKKMVAQFNGVECWNELIELEFEQNKLCQNCKCP